MNELLKNIAKLINKFKSLDIEQALDWEKYNHYSLVHHSTSIEGATLTEEETQLLLEDNITAKGKPIEHHLMQKDHLAALNFVIDLAKNKKPILPYTIKEIGSLIMQNTGSLHNTALGSFDSTKGDLRLVNVHAGTTRFVDFTKVPGLIDKFCQELNEKMENIRGYDDALLTSFDAHFNLVSIHPFVDGNGRMSRLIMNYVQHYNRLPLAIVFKEDKADYYKALIDTREKEDMNIFRTFMLNQYTKMLEIEINKALEAEKEHIKGNNNKKGLGMSMIF